MSRWVVIGCTLLLSWLGMMVVHEAGHVAVAWLTGAEVARVLLHPLEFSRTELGANPFPLAVAWGGAWIGCLLPLAGYQVTRLLQVSGQHHLRFFAGSCLVMNGVYFVVGTLERAADPGDILRHGGTETWLLIFGLGALGGGLALWNGLGRHFGLGPGAEPPSAREAWGLMAVVSLLVGAELVLSARGC